MMETIHCPTCGEEMYEIDVEDPESFEDEGAACPNKCGWISVEQQGEALAVKVGICSY